MTKIAITAEDVESHHVVYRDSFSIEPGEFHNPDVSRIRSQGAITLEFAAWFDSGAVVRATAHVRDLAEIQVSHPSEKQIAAVVWHILTATAAVYARASPEAPDCLLQCPDTGKRSTGPCIECSDDEYTIRLCC
jgi:hypothetical protein